MKIAIKYIHTNIHKKQNIFRFSPVDFTVQGFGTILMNVHYHWHWLLVKHRIEFKILLPAAVTEVSWIRCVSSSVFSRDPTSSSRPAWQRCMKDTRCVGLFQIKICQVQAFKGSKRREIAIMSWSRIQPDQ